MIAVETAYGSDATGLIWGYHFKQGCAAVLVNAEQALTLLINKPEFEQGEFLWLHFSVSNSSSVPWLKKQLQLPNAFFESLSVNAGAARLEQEKNGLVAVIHDVQLDLTFANFTFANVIFESSNVATSSLYVDSRLFVSARLRPLRSLEQLRVSVRHGDRFESSSDLLAHLLINQANVLLSILRESTRRTDDIEDKFLAHRISFSRSELGLLRRVLVRLQRLLAPEPATFFRLLNRPPLWICAGDLQVLRQAAEEFSAAVGDAQALIERVKLLQEELAALVNEQTNRTLHVLTLVTVLALPINLVAGLLGMNVGGLPLANSGFGFTLVVLVLAALTASLGYFALIRRRN
ncbi:MAG: CorA family divalent cation transporter [Marinagarivorans sp.]|nr:CorA family divalent cation transporter [Marinagarivorans sp.]